MTLQGSNMKMSKSDEELAREPTEKARRDPRKNPRSYQHHIKAKANKPDLSITKKGRTTHLEQDLLEGCFVTFDIETTGGNPEKNGITEIFALRYHHGKVVDTFYSMVNPEVPIPPIVRRMTGITNKMVKDAPKIEEIIPGFVDFVGEDVLVSHNTIGDMKFLRYFSQKVTGSMMDNYYLCTHLLVEKLVPEAPDKSLKGLATFFSLNSGRQLHRAEADAYLTLELFRVLLERLLGKGILRIMDAIRFQGDYESGMRLGWGIAKDSLKHLPESPGVFYLYDYLGNVTFLSAAHNIAREVKRLQRLSQLPRQLLKSVLASTEVKFVETRTPFAAALAEAEGVYQHKIKFDPANWHQRTANFLYVKGDESHFRFGTGPLGEDVVLALGPIRGGREVSLLMEQMGRVFKKKITKKGLRLSEKEGHLALEFLNRRKLELGFFGRLKSWFANLRADPVIEDIRQELRELSVPIELHNLEACSGILAVPHDDQWHVYSVASGIPLDEMILQGDLIQSLKKNDLNLKVFKKIKLAIYRHRKGPRPLRLSDTLMINRTFWWAYFGSRHEDVRVLPLDELIKM